MRVDFFFGGGSRYSYLASTQIERISAETGAVFVWQPLFSGDLIARAGGNFKSPQDPSWRAQDAARWARHYGVPYVEPKGQADWRVVALHCVAAARLGAAEAFGRAVLHLSYGQGLVPDGGRLSDVAAKCGLDPQEVTAFAKSDEALSQHEQNIRAALAVGAFGVPTFVTEAGAVIWGQDRLALLKDCLLFGDVTGGTLTD